MSALKRFTAIVFLLLIIWSVHGQEIETILADFSKKHNLKITEQKIDTFFTKKYLLEISQPVDHKGNTDETFTQRVYLSHLDFNRPVVIITEGYAAGYASNPRYINELAGLMNANQVCVEHRYFGKSVPTSREWDFLTIENAATDYHQIIQLLSEIYPGKWISTGISKGGQTTIFHRFFYPEDVEASVAFVAPVNFSPEDKRVYRFLSKVGDSVSRQRVYQFQYELLKNKKRYLPEFQNLADKKKLTYQMGILEAYELTVLEYAFAFWQWGVTPVDSIPSVPKSPEFMVKHLHQVADIEWVSNEGTKRMLPFFVQAMKEIGFYGYDIEPFKDVISFRQNPVFTFTIPPELEINYNPEPMKKVDHFIRHEAQQMIFIYGSCDPWTATTAEITYNKPTVLKFIKPDGSHMTRIRNLSESQKDKVLSTLKEWIGD